MGSGQCAVGNGQWAVGNGQWVWGKNLGLRYRLLSGRGITRFVRLIPDGQFEGCTSSSLFIPTTVLQNARFFRNEFEEFSRNEDCVNAGHRVYCLVVSHPDTSAQPERPVAMLTSAGISGKLFGVRDTSHTKLNDDLGLPDDAATKVLFEFVAEALKKSMPDRSGVNLR